jgi:hypothetical protein
MMRVHNNCSLSFPLRQTHKLTPSNNPHLSHGIFLDTCRFEGFYAPSLLLQSLELHIYPKIGPIGFVSQIIDLNFLSALLQIWPLGKLIQLKYESKQFNYKTNM